MASDTEGKSQPLLPGIPNEVTLDNITPKLSWRDLFMLSSVSRAWRHANRSRQVYTARLRQDSCETLVLIDYAHQTRLGHLTSSRQRGTLQSEGTRRVGRGACDRGGPYQAAELASSGCNGVALYSMRDSSCCELPPIPNVAGGFPEFCQFVSLDGKVYVLGGRYSRRRKSWKVYVLDLVVQGQWRKCANMLQPRARTECVVIDGKIYVSGGSFRCGSEVYDPKEDSWSRIEWNAISLRFPHRAETLGEEFLLYDRISFIREVLEEESNDGLDHVWRLMAAAAGLEVPQTPCFFMSRGKLHRMRSLSRLEQYVIEVHSADENTWTSLHSFTFDATGRLDYNFFMPMAVLAWKDELLAVVSWCNRHGGTGFCLLQSKGFCSMTHEIWWQKVFELTFSLQNQAMQQSLLERNICMHAIKL